MLDKLSSTGPTPSTAPLHVYLVGSHSTGKTTLARWISQTYGIPMISEVARAVLAEMELKIDSLRTDIELVNKYQRAVFQRQTQAERAQRGSFVSDRAFDSLAYSAEHSLILKDLMESTNFTDYVAWLSEGTIFFLRPEPELLSQDGVRERASWDGVVRIDGMLKFMLEQFGLQYVPIGTASMQERVRIVKGCLRVK